MLLVRCSGAPVHRVLGWSSPEAGAQQWRQRRGATACRAAQRRQPGAPPAQAQLAELRAALAEAVSSEDFVLAASVRDKIAALEREDPASVLGKELERAVREERYEVGDQELGCPPKGAAIAGAACGRGSPAPAAPGLPTPLPAGCSALPAAARAGDNALARMHSVGALLIKTKFFFSLQDAALLKLKLDEVQQQAGAAPAGLQRSPPTHSEAVTEGVRVTAQRCGQVAGEREHAEREQGGRSGSVRTGAGAATVGDLRRGLSFWPGAPQAGKAAGEISGWRAGAAPGCLAPPALTLLSMTLGGAAAAAASTSPARLALRRSSLHLPTT